MFRIRTSVSYGGRRRYLAVTRGKDGWYLQWGDPTPYGHTFEKPCAGPFETKREAREVKRMGIEGSA